MHETARVGHFLVTAIVDVEGRMDLGDLFDADPPPADLDLLPSLYPDDYTEAGWRFLCRCFLVEGGDAPVLIDLGSGPEGSEVHRETGMVGTLLQDLAGLGVSPADVGDVILTHAHTDHTGWSCLAAGDGGFFPTFPGARYHLHAADLQECRASTSEEGRRWFASDFAPLEAAGQLVATDTDDVIVPGIRVEHQPGHTVGHRIALIESGDERLVAAGDLVHFTHQFEDEAWLSPLDEDQRAALATRRKVFDRLEREGVPLATTHLPFAFIRLGRRDGVRVMLRDGA